jgi:hypothetical protein
MKAVLIRNGKRIRMKLPSRTHNGVYPGTGKTSILEHLVALGAQGLPEGADFAIEIDGTHYNVHITTAAEDAAEAARHEKIMRELGLWGED